MDLRIPITKLFCVLLILYLFSETENHVEESAFFDHQKWTIRDAFRALFCVTGMVFTCSVLSPLWISAHISYYEMGIWAMLWSLFITPLYNEIKTQHGAIWRIVGIDKTHFLGSGVLALSVALCYFSLSAVGVEIPLLHSVGAGSIPLCSWLDAATFGFGLPFCEELLFRGLLYAPLARQAGKWTAIVMLALLECLLYVNLDVAHSAAMFAVFVVFYLIYMRTESLWAPIILHMGMNIPFWQPMSMSLMAHYVPAETVKLMYVFAPLWLFA